MGGAYAQSRQEGNVSVPLRDKVSPAPSQIRLAGALNLVPGLALIGIALAMAVRMLTGHESGEINDSFVYAQVGYYVVLGAGVLACAVGLLLGQSWARSPAVVVSLVLIGVGWYVTGPSHQPGFGVPLMLLGISMIVLLFRRPSRAWALGQMEGETEAEASFRGGAGNRKRRGEGES